MGCYVEDYRASVGTCGGKFSWREMPRFGEDTGTNGDCLVLTLLSLMTLVLLLMISGIEQNPGLVVEVQNTAWLLCTGWGWNLMLGIQCELCEGWYHYSGGGEKAQASERQNANCGKC
jgi:hypothetical protein